ncbi:hypothetical protein EDD36DRAFT_221238 [Exophiala viscosa]|uniref:DUF7587 domain-containing protein n=1 Tax=Exophiala viscosa TaxID=2486360 RepID=A0AAN6DX56_9EURO|nr:hypothetical protein EDD36DRAFT_221238 [Exophiala viscosa]
MSMEDQPLRDILNQQVPKHVWTAADRELLAVAQKLYDMSNKQLTKVFNHLHWDQLLEEGFAEGLKVTAISSQIADLKRTVRGNEFRAILSMAPTAVYQKHGGLASVIEKAARDLGILLQCYAGRNGYSDASPVKRPLTARSDDWADVTDEEEDSPPARKRRSIQTPSPADSTPLHVRQPTGTTTPASNATPITTSSVSLSFIDSCSPGSYRLDSNPDENEYQNLDRHHFAATSDKIPPLLRIRYDDKGRYVPTRPRLLFRAYNPQHKLIARRFLGQEKILDAPPPLWTSDEFCCMARSHLCEDKTFPSPFLSWTENPKRALDLIVESDGSETSLSLAVVDYNVLERDLIRRFGEGAGPWLVKTICDTFGLSDLNRIHDNKSKTHESRKGYTGTGEFLTWCSVQCDLLVGTLDTAAAMKLYKTMEDMKRISYKAGLVLGECLQDTDMNDIYREVVSYKLTRAFKKLDCLKGSPRYKSFIQGVYGEDYGDPADNSSSDDDQQILEDSPCDKSDGIFGGRLDKPRDQLRTGPDNWTSLGETEVQCLVDAQLSETGALFGVAGEGGDFMGEAEAGSTIGVAEATTQPVSTTNDGAADIVKVELSQFESTTKVLDIPEWQPTKTLRGDRDAGKKTLGQRSSAKFNAFKVLEAQQATILAGDERTALSLDLHADTRRNEGQPTTNVPSRRRSSVYIDLTDDNDPSSHQPRKKHANTGLVDYNATIESTTLHPVVSPASTPQANKPQDTNRPSAVKTTNGVTNDTLHDIIEDEDEDDEVQLISTATVRQRRTVRTRTRTVLTYRSRSLSEAAGHTTVNTRSVKDTCLH